MRNSDSDGRPWWRDDVLSALALLTRLPLPDHRPRGARSAWVWPLVGAMLGATAAAAAAVGVAAGLPGGAVAAAVLATTAVLTGALHEDGLADTADGLFGGHTPERRLQIMKDSHIGSYGALALVLVTLAAWSALEVLIRAGALPALIASAALSRAAMAGVMAALPNARGTGFAHAVGQPTQAMAGTACAVGLGVALACAGTAGLWMAAATAATAAGVAMVARAKIGGQTGDILGAAQQLSALAALCTATATLP